MENIDHGPCIECGEPMGEVENLPLVHYGRGIYAVESIYNIPCTACPEVSTVWTAMGRLSVLGDLHPERPLYARLQESDRTWHRMESPDLAARLLSTQDSGALHDLVTEVIDTRDYTALPVLLELMTRPFTQGHRDILLLPVWLLCDSRPIEGTSQPMPSREHADLRGCLIVSGHWKLLVDVVCNDSWDVAHYASKILLLVGLPKTLRPQLEAADNDIARELLELTE